MEDYNVAHALVLQIPPSPQTSAIPLTWAISQV
jgi:hypothetical protein